MIASSPPPLQTARFALMVGGLGGGGNQTGSFFFPHYPEGPSGFPGAFAVQHAFAFLENTFTSQLADRCDGVSHLRVRSDGES